MKRFTHLDALTDGLARERQRLEAATSDSERALRRVWIAQREKEISEERRLLQMADETPQTDSELLAALGL